MFNVIPAVDLMNGIVVHGKGGQRDRYQPIQSILSPGADPLDVVTGLLAFHPFNTIYIADLDAIGSDGGSQASGHQAIVVELLRRWPQLNIWCDYGMRSAEDFANYPTHPRLFPIAGTETLTSLTSLELMHVRDRPFVLSLDFKNGHPLGAAEVAANPALWPSDVIVLSLDRVGSAGGPPMTELSLVDKHAHTATDTTPKLPGAATRRVYTGGGVSDARDLRTVRASGAAGAVVATAIHSGAISAQEIGDIVAPA